MSAAELGYRIERLRSARALEFVAYFWPEDTAAHEDWPVAPGGARRDAQRQPSLLHYAPGRWLAPQADAKQQSAFEAAATGGAGVSVDVTGKWSGFELSGPGATRLLAFTIDIAAVLAGRECAAVTLLDCPAIVARFAAGFRIWVQSSYAAHFLETAAQCGAALRREG